MLNYSIPAMKQVKNPANYMAKQHRSLYLSKIPIGTKFHTVSDRCFARHEPLGESKGLWIYSFHELEVVSTLKLANAVWYEVKLTENNVGSPTYWVYEHCITPSKYEYNMIKAWEFFDSNWGYISWTIFVLGVVLSLFR